MSAAVLRPTPTVVRTERELERVIPLLRYDLRYAAWVIAEHDRAYAADLYQEALIYLWGLDPSRFTADEIGYLRNAAVRRMIRLGRREAARRQELPIDRRFK